MTKQRHDICCPAVSSVVRWSQSTEHMVQLVCGLLLSVVLLVSQQATEKSKIITKREVKLSVKTYEKCPLSALFQTTCLEYSAVRILEESLQPVFSNR